MSGNVSKTTMSDDEAAHQDDHGKGACSMSSILKSKLPAQVVKGSSPSAESSGSSPAVSVKFDREVLAGEGFDAKPSGTSSDSRLAASSSQFQKTAPGSSTPSLPARGHHHHHHHSRYGERIATKVTTQRPSGGYPTRQETVDTIRHPSEQRCGKNRWQRAMTRLKSEKPPELRNGPSSHSTDSLEVELLTTRTTVIKDSVHSHDMSAVLPSGSRLLYPLTRRLPRPPCRSCRKMSGPCAPPEMQRPGSSSRHLSLCCSNPSMPRLLGLYDRGEDYIPEEYRQRIYRRRNAVTGVTFISIGLAATVILVATHRSPSATTITAANRPLSNLKTDWRSSAWTIVILVLSVLFGIAGMLCLTTAFCLSPFGRDLELTHGSTETG